MELPPTLFNFATHNEDASVERLVLEALGPKAKTPMRVACVAASGTNALTICSSPDVACVDAVDPAVGQLRLSALLRSTVEVLQSPEELAVFIGNSGDGAERRKMYAHVRDNLDEALQTYWDGNVQTVVAGVLRCGGAERCIAIMRDHLPTPDLVALSKQPAAILDAYSHGITMETQRANMHIPEAAMKNIVEHGVAGIAAQLSKRLTECAGGEPDFMVELQLHGAYPMEPISSRPCFLRPDIYAEIRQNGCGRDRLAFHEGPLEVVGSQLAKKEGAYDLVDMSNILDMGSREQAAATLRGVAEAVRPGGALLCRSHSESGGLVPLFESCGLRVDEALSAQARAAESSFFMNDVCVAFTR